MTDFTERILAHPRDQVIEFRGAEASEFIDSIPDHQLWLTGEKLKDFLRRHNATVIRGEPVPSLYLDETVRTGFGYVFGRDWYFE